MMTAEMVMMMIPTAPPNTASTGIKHAKVDTNTKSF